MKHIWMNNRKNAQAERGIGLIEVLIAVFVLAVGAMALTRMHSAFFETSAESKAKAEAMSLAQDRIEDRRNYLADVRSRSDFETLFPLNTTTDLGDFEGINANFSMEETIAGAGLGRTVAVDVSWTSSSGDAQSITLDTEFTYAPPYVIEAQIQEGPLSPYPTGRARLGEGIVDVDNTIPDVDNNDGTELYQDVNNTNNLLLVTGDGTVVLTLVDACNTGAGSLTTDGGAIIPCTDFVRVSGRIYIDTASSNVDAGEVFVQTSNAGFCTRFLDDGTSVVNSDVDAELTLSGDYKYFNYTCYVGGGWRGNVGIQLAGGIAQTDKMCLGDPNSIFTRDQPVIALRRNYSGMKRLATDLSANPVYYSQGIKDAAVLTEHDFVVSEMAASTTEGTACVTEEIMMRTDSLLLEPDDTALPFIGVYGTLFSGNPGDFFCLNENSNTDTFGMDGYYAPPLCPYDPSAPPANRWIISGVINLNSNLASAINPTGTNISDGITADDGDAGLINRIMSINTTDGRGNCELGEFDTGGSPDAAYTCYVYDFGTGWNGELLLDYLSFTDTDGVSPDNSYDFTEYELISQCSPADADSSFIFTDQTGHVSDNDFDCSSATLAQIRGTVNAEPGFQLLSAVMSNGGRCTVAVDGTRYACTTGDLGTGGLWTGTITFTSSGNGANGDVCTDTSTDPDILATANHIGTATFSTGFSGLRTLPVTILRSCP